MPYRNQKQFKLFATKQVKKTLTPLMIDFIKNCELLFLSSGTATKQHCGIRFGEKGFVTVSSPSQLSYIEYKGNGVRDTLENFRVNKQIGMLFIDFEGLGLGLHVSGLVEQIEAHEDSPKTPYTVKVQVQECFIQCRKHLPRYKKVDRNGQYDPEYFVKHGKPTDRTN